MKLATTPEEQRQWMRQWRRTAVFLEEMRRYELARLTPEEARRQARSVLSVPGGWRDPNAVCGLIEQQAIFQRLRKK